MSFLQRPSIESFNAIQRQRYAGHLALDEIGPSGQLKLLQSKILCIGAGGLGSPVAAYLAATGVGVLGVVDDDVVDRSNLQRQILHREESIGLAKTLSAQATLAAQNQAMQINLYPERLNDSNAERIIKDYDIVVDGTDNYVSRYLVSDTCRELNKPHVYGAVHEFFGQVAVFWPDQQGNRPCYRCLYCEEHQAEQANCTTHGVLGMVPGVIGTLQVIEVIKLITGCGAALLGELLLYDALQVRFRKVKVGSDQNCRCQENRA